jgi:hypothetical protein
METFESRERFTRFEELKRLIKELGYKKTKDWRFQKDVSDLLWVEFDFGITGWKSNRGPHLLASIGDRRFARIVADTSPFEVPAFEREHFSCTANILPNVPEIGRELFGKDWVYNYSFTDSTYDQLETETRTLDNYMVSKISEATIEELVWRNNIMDNIPTSIICHLLGQGRYDEAVKHYLSHRIVDTERIGIRRWLLKNGLIDGPEDPWAEERKKISPEPGGV